MISFLMYSVYVILFSAPLNAIRYYPFIAKLRVSMRVFLVLYTFLTLINIRLFFMFSLGNTAAFHLVFLLIYFLFSCVMIKERFSKHFFVWLITVILYTYPIEISRFMEIRFGTVIPGVVFNASMLLQLLFMMPAAFIFMRKIIMPLLDNIDEKTCRIMWLLPATIFAMGALSSMMAKGGIYIAIRFFGFGGFVAILMILSRMMQESIENVKLRDERRKSEHLIETAREQYKVLRARIDEARIARHDLNHHISAIQSYLNSGSYDKLSLYLENYRGTLPDEELTFCCNHTLNMVLSYYVSRARKLGITAEFRASVPDMIKVPDHDLWVLLGNCLDNAIEACSRQCTGEKIIKLNAMVKSGFVGVTITNSHCGVCVENGSYISLKSGSGLGISSVTTIAERYGGCAKFEHDDKMFYVSLMFNAN